MPLRYLTMFPAWLDWLAIASLVVALASAAVIVLDELRQAQAVWIMNLVWPLTALFGGLLALGFYWRFGRASSRDGSNTKSAPQQTQELRLPSQQSAMAITTAKSSLHCGAGCTLGDLISEWLAFAWPGAATLFGWRSVFGEKTFSVWIMDFLTAFAFGVAIQYFTIKPLRNLSTRDGLVQALKADAASIVAWQVGMYAGMAAAQFAWLRPAYGTPAPVDSPVFWFVMQISMLFGFATSYPVNWLLVRAGIKERM